MMSFCTRSDATSAISKVLAASKFLGYITTNSKEPAPPAPVMLFSISTASPSTNFPQHKTIFVADLGDARLRLRRSLPVVLEAAGDGIVAYSHDLEELANGPDESSAIAEMKALIAESFFLLREEQQALGPLQQAHWSFLKDMIEEIA